MKKKLVKLKKFRKTIFGDLSHEKLAYANILGTVNFVLLDEAHHEV